MKIIGVTGKKNTGQTIRVEGADETFRVKPGLDLTRFVDREVKALFMGAGRFIVGVEHKNGSVTGDKA